MPPPIGKRPRVYDIEERKVIDVYKADYMKTTSPGERRSMAQGLIFPKLFTYWSENGITLTQEEIDIRTDVSGFLNLN
jgi:hypothetical protein